MTSRSTEELIAEARLHAEQVNRFGKVDGKPCLYDLLADRLTELSTPDPDEGLFEFSDADLLDRARELYAMGGFGGDASRELADKLIKRVRQLATPAGGGVPEALNAEAINDLVASLKRREDSCAKQAKKKSGGDRCVVKGKEAAYSHAAQLVAEAANLAKFSNPVGGAETMTTQSTEDLIAEIQRALCMDDKPGAKSHPLSGTQRELYQHATDHLAQLSTPSSEEGK